MDKIQFKIGKDQENECVYKHTNESQKVNAWFSLVTPLRNCCWKKNTLTKQHFLRKSTLPMQNSKNESKEKSHKY